MRTAMRTMVLTAGLLLAVGCGGDDDADDAATTTAGDDVTSTTAANGDSPRTLPDTPLRATLDRTYPSVGFDADAFGVESGSITAAWYAVGDRWAVHYDGLTREAALGKCPGNSIQQGDGFAHISNSPYGALACEGYEDLATYGGTILPPGSLHLCDDALVVYVTEIPLTASGALWGSLEQVREDGTIQGMTSRVEADADRAPEIAVDDCAVVS